MVREGREIYRDILSGITSAAERFMKTAGEYMDEDGDIPEDLKELENLIMDIEDIILDYGVMNNE